MPEMKTDEQVLVDYWTKPVVEKNRFEHMMERPRLTDDDKTVKEMKNGICELIFKGEPLYREEFHVAVAFGFLLTEESYIAFYKKGWHETATHFGYGGMGPRRCDHCKNS